MATFFFVLSVLMVSISTYKANISKTKYLQLTEESQWGCV